MKAGGVVGIIGGSGLYQMEGLSNVREQAVSTPFGRPSDKYITGTLEGRKVSFLPRHGRKHAIMPSEINHRANIYGFKKLGVEWILSVSAVGSLKEEYRPLDIVLVDQFFDRTKQGREATFFGGGIVAHISLADPVCGGLLNILREACAQAVPGVKVHAGGTYVNMEGPAFSTRAESNTYRKMGFDVIGMTNLTEAKLAREAEISYATMAMVTDYDCWHEVEEDVTVQAIVENLRRNAANAKAVLRAALRKIPYRHDCACSHALEFAILTDKKAVAPAAKKKLGPLIQKYI